jgi:hypothetical protein
MEHAKEQDDQGRQYDPAMGSRASGESEAKRLGEAAG